MSRIPRIVVPGMVHHVLQHGHEHEAVFCEDADRIFYLDRLRHYASQYGLLVLAYCLLRNRLHLLVVPTDKTALTRTLSRTDYDYARHFNQVSDRTGRLWRQRFESCAIGQHYFLQAAAFVERAPLRAGLAEPAWRWCASSAAAHLALVPAHPILELHRWQTLVGATDWSGALAQSEKTMFMTRIRYHTRTGYPLAYSECLNRLEQRLARPMRPRPIGHPVWDKDPS